MKRRAKKLPTVERSRHGRPATALLVLPLLFGISGAIWSGRGESPLGGGSGISEAQAKALQAKLQDLSSASVPPGSSLEPVVITDDEANSYIRYHGREFLPKGVSDTVLHIMPDGIQGTAKVNFDEIDLATGQNDWGAKAVSMIFRGEQRVSAFGNLHSSGGKATLEIENVHIGPTVLNDWLVNWLLQNYVESKYKIDLSKPLPLPAHVTAIDLVLGKATLERSLVKK